jgi:hypothetical protein
MMPLLLSPRGLVRRHRPEVALESNTLLRLGALLIAVLVYGFFEP